MSYPATTATSTTAAAAATATAVEDNEADKESSLAVTDASAAGVGSKGMMEFFRKRCKSGNTGDSAQAIGVCETMSSTDAECKSLVGEGTTTDIDKHCYYHTVSSSDARVLRAALAKQRVPIFRRSESKARRSMAGAGVRFAYPKDRSITEGETLQPFSSTRSDSKSFRDIFLRRRNKSDRSDPSTDISGEVKPKSGGVRIRNFLVSFRSRPSRSASVSYAPVDASSNSSSTSATASSSPAATVQTVGKRKKFRVTPATLLPGLKRSEPPRVGPEDFVEMYCRSRTTSDPRSDAILKARVAANLHKVNAKYSAVTHTLDTSQSDL